MAKQEETKPYKGHVWFYRPNRTAQVVQHEFGMAITKEEAERRIAAMHDLDKLDSDATVSHRQLETLSETSASAEPEPVKPEPVSKKK